MNVKTLMYCLILAALIILVGEARNLIRVENDNHERIMEIQTMVTSMYTQGRVGQEVK
jgi:hypothetical protein